MKLRRATREPMLNLGGNQRGIYQTRQNLRRTCFQTVSLELHHFLQCLVNAMLGTSPYVIIMPSATNRCTRFGTCIKQVPSDGRAHSFSRLLVRGLTVSQSLIPLSLHEDMGLAKFVIGKSYTTCGTPEPRPLRSIGVTNHAFSTSCHATA